MDPLDAISGCARVVEGAKFEWTRLPEFIWRSSREEDWMFLNVTANGINSRVPTDQLRTPANDARAKFDLRFV